jgi:chemotaxis protein histidine kinase CheA
MDILLDAESLLSRWQQQPGQREPLDSLLDQLTSLGHAAHLADLWQMDDVCEALLDLYGAVEEGSLGASPRFFAVAQQAHEAMLDMLDEVAAGQDVSPRPDCVDALRGLLDGALKAGLNEIRSVSLGVAQPDAYKDKARKAAIDDAVHQAQELAAGFHSKLGPVYSVRYHVSNYQPSPMVRMMKAADAAPVSAQETYEQATIQFDDQVDVVFELQPAQAAAPATPAKPAETPKPAQ